MLSVGVPREMKPGEKRVGLTPQGARVFREAGIRVLVEKGAGEESDFSDEDYRKAGAEVVRLARAIYEKAELIKKVKEPLPEEWDFLRPDLILFCFLHLASPENRALVKTLVERKVMGIGLETVEKNGRAIFLEPMSEIAGVLAAYDAGFFRQRVRVESGRIVYPSRFFEKLERLASQFPDIPEHLPPGKVMVFGGGTVGCKAVEVLLKMGGEVDLVEKREERRKMLQAEFQAFGSRFRCWGLQDNFVEPLRTAEVWMGCVHILGERAPLVLSREEVEEFSRGRPKLILDIAVDQGGNFPETHSTSYEDPLYLDSFGNLRFGVANMPSLCGRGASEALEETTLNYAIRLAQDWKEAFRELPELQGGLQVFKGKVVHEAIARAHQFPWEPFKEADLG